MSSISSPKKSILLSVFSILITGVTFFLPHIALAENILSDGDMEANILEPWRRYGPPQVLEKSQAMAFEGVQSMHIQGNELTGKGGFQQVNIPVEAGKTYTLSLYYFIVEGNFNTWMGIKTSNGAFDGRVDTLVTPGEWQLYTRQFTVPDNFIDDFRYMLNMQGGEAYIDSVEINEVIEEPPAEEPIDENPDEPPIDEEENPQEEPPVEEEENENPEPEEEIGNEDEDMDTPSSGGNSTPETPREIPPLDFDAINFPTNTIVINNGETETATRTIALHFRINGITDFALNTNAQVVSSSFVTFTSTTTWDLPSGNGEKNFFVHFRTKQGYILTIPQSIILNEIQTTPETGGYELPPQPEEIKNQTNCPLFQRRVYRLDTGKEFYITPSCTKREFKNNYVFHTYRESLRPVHNTTLEKLNEVADDTEYYFMPLGPQYRVKTGDLLKLADDPKVYFIVENKKYWIRSETVFYHLGHNWNQVKTVDTEVLDILEEGGTIG